MANDADNQEKSSAALQEEIQKRKDWFFECQIRRLYLEAFRDVEVNGQDPELLNLISELPQDPNPLGSMGKPTPVYLDSQQPVWTREERDRRLAFKDISTGSWGNWLNYGETTKLA